VRSLREIGIDVTTAADALRRGLSDEDQLRFAVGQRRTLYTHNLADYTRLHGEWMRAGRHHAGIIVVRTRQTPIGAQVQALTKLAATLSPDDMADRLEYLSNWLD
jgi:hypothetical protein